MIQTKFIPAFVISLSFVLSACAASSGKYFDFEDANKVTNGMTKQEVISIMKTSPYQVQDDNLTWSWAKVNMLTGKTESRAAKFNFGSDGKTYGIKPGGIFKDITPYIDD